MNGNLRCIRLLNQGQSILRHPFKTSNVRPKYIPSSIYVINALPLNHTQTRAYAKKKGGNKKIDNKMMQELMKGLESNGGPNNFNFDEMFSGKFPGSMNSKNLDEFEPEDFDMDGMLGGNDEDFDFSNLGRNRNKNPKPKKKASKDIDFSELGDLDPSQFVKKYLKQDIKNRRKEESENIDDTITHDDIMENFAGTGFRESKESKQSKARFMEQLNELSERAPRDEVEEAIADPYSLEEPLFSPFELVSKDEPEALAKPEYITLHGKKHVDDFTYMRNIDTDEDVQKYCSEEENYGNLILANQFSSVASYFYVETSSMTTHNEPTILNKMEDYYYFRVEGERDFIYYRKKGLVAQDEMFFNADEESVIDGRPSIIKDVKVSKSHKYFAFLRDTNGEGICQLSIRDIKTGKTIRTFDNVINYDFGHEDVVYFTDLDAERKPSQLKRFDVTADNPKIIFHSDEAFYLDVYSISDYKYVILIEYSMEAVTTFIITPDGQNIKVHRGLKEDDMIIKRAGNHFYTLVMNENRTNKSLMKFTLENAMNKSKWEKVIENTDGLEILSINTHEKYLVLREKVHGYDNIRTINIETNESFDVPLPSKLSTTEFIENSDYHGNRFKFRVSSPLIPPQIYEYDMKYNKIVLIDKDDYVMPKGGLKIFNPEEFDEYKVMIGKHAIPLSIVHKKSLVKDGTNPTLMIVHGANGTSLETSYNPAYTSLLERGFIIAFAHVRGGGEKGTNWFNMAKVFNKKNSIDDFLECTNYLIKEKYTSSEHLAAKASEEGCVILGNVANNFPTLFRSMSMNEPLVDIATTFVDERKRFFEDDIQEFGDPMKEDEYNNIIKYDPYANIKDQEYPHILLTCGSEYSKYPIHHGLKYSAKLRKHKLNNDTLLLTKPKLINLNISPEQREIKDRSDEMAFVCGTLGVWPKRFE